jgi:hypothetical protein
VRLAYLYRKFPEEIRNQRRFGHSVTIIVIPKKLKTNQKMTNDQDDQLAAYSNPDAAMYQ